MLGFCLGAYYGFVLGFLGAVAWRHWTSLYEPRTFIHVEPDNGVIKVRFVKTGPIPPMPYKLDD